MPGPDQKFIAKHLEIPGIETLKVAEQSGTYTHARRIVKEMDPKDVIEAVKASGLRGLGGAGFPTGVKWGFVPPKQEGKLHYLVVNADEGEPGTCKDRYILQQTPHLLIAGIIICCHAIHAEKCYIYVRGEYIRPMEKLQAAIDEAYEAGMLGENHLGSGKRLDVVVHAGAGAYICGEETALIESLEGKKGQPRNKPPFPAVVGLFGRPTVMNNVETLAYLPFIFEHGPEKWAEWGHNGCGGYRLMCISGHVEKPGVYELPMGTPLMRLIDEFGGGVWKGRKLKAVIPGGLSAPILTPDECEKALLDFQTLKEMGSMAGSGGIIVIDDQTSIVDVLINCAHFYHDESCGQCTPCREGTWWMYRICQRIARGEGRERDVDELVRIASNIEGNTICAFGEAAAWPIRSYARKFRDEILDFIRSGKRASEADWNHEHRAAPPLVQVQGVGMPGIAAGVGHA